MLFENLKMALSALYTNKMRSFLTMLGIIIGIGAVIITNALGDSVRKMFSDLFSNIGITMGIVQLQMDEVRESDFFNTDDMEQFQRVYPDQIKYIDSWDRQNVDVKTLLKNIKLNFNGVRPNFLDFQPTLQIVKGRFINESDEKKELKNVVLRDKDAKDLFGTIDVVGRKFRGKFYQDLEEFTIVGVYTQKLSPVEEALLSVGGGTNDAFVPFSLFKYDHDLMYQMRIFADKQMSNEEIKSFYKEFKTYLVRYKQRTEEDYIIHTAENNFQQTDAVLGTVSVVLGSIAGISLLVGGIGIMNIMLVSVTERTREIGIRKALGATTRDILTQFLIESAVLSAVGGIFGVVLAVSIVSIVGIVSKTAVVISPISIVVAVGFSAIVGLFFGLYPARKAATKDPIEALRFE